MLAALRSALTSRRQAQSVQMVGIRCEQGGASNSLDIWIGRAAMLGFVAAIGVEVSTGKGVLEVCLHSIVSYTWLKSASVSGIAFEKLIKLQYGMAYHITVSDHSKHEQNETLRVKFESHMHLREAMTWILLPA